MQRTQPGWLPLVVLLLPLALALAVAQAQAQNIGECVKRKTKKYENNKKVGLRKGLERLGDTLQGVLGGIS